jgi:hypothetical protein
LRRAARGARRLWPVVLMAREWWERLSPEEKQRYKSRVRGYADRGRQAVDRRRGKR